MSYIHIESGKILTRKELEDAHRDPYVSFPEQVDDETLAEFGYANVTYSEKPEVPQDKVLKVGPVKKVCCNEGWQYTWILEDRQVHSTEIDAERDRRIDAGFMFKDHLIQSKPTDRENISGAVQLALIATLNGVVAGDLRWLDPESDFSWITADNAIIPMDAFDVMDLGRKAASVKQNLIFKARILKDMEVIPTNFTDDEWWTS